MHRRFVLAALVVLVAWTVIAFVVLSPNAPYSGDLGIKFVQAKSLVRSGLHSMALLYPGAMIDATWRYFPVRPPFIFSAGDGIQGIFPTTVALMNAPFASLGGLAGMIVLALLAGFAVLWATGRIAGQDAHAWALPVVLGLGTCLWFYAVQPWEHTVAVALGLAALVIALPNRERVEEDRAVAAGSTIEERPPVVHPAVRLWRAPGGRGIAAGLLLGLGVTLRHESLLLLPGLLLALWLRERRPPALVAACAAVGGVLLAAAFVDTFVYGRPFAAHALLNVSLVRRAFQAAHVSTASVPTVPTLSMTERYETVVHYWLVSDVSRLTVLVFLVAACAAAALERWKNSSLGVLALALTVLGWSAYGFLALLPAPRWVAGLVPLSPFLVFALFPAPQLSPGARATRRFALAASACFIGLAILTTDTAGGKSLGPRLLLPVLPILVVAAWESIVEYLRAPVRLDRWAGRLGLALVACALVMHVAVTIPAYVGRSAGDGAAVQQLRTSPIPIVITDDYATAQLVLPLYFQKAMFLADSQALANDLAATLSRQQFGQLMVISRRPPEARFDLPGFRRSASTIVGRMTIEEWHR